MPPGRCLVGPPLTEPELPFHLSGLWPASCPWGGAATCVCQPFFHHWQALCLGRVTWPSELWFTAVPEKKCVPASRVVVGIRWANAVITQCQAPGKVFEQQNTFVIITSASSTVLRVGFMPVLILGSVLLCPLSISSHALPSAWTALAPAGPL